jgi:ribosomal protein L15
MVGKMKPNTAVRLIGINETYNSYEEIKHFYDILDTKKGLTADGETVDKASLIAKGFISAKTVTLVKVLGNGDITKKLTVNVDKVSESAKAKIEKAGGSVVVAEKAAEEK